MENFIFCVAVFPVKVFSNKTSQGSHRTIF